MEIQSKNCSRCGAAQSFVLEGMCPGCLIDIDPETPESFSEGAFGDYELVKEIAQGGMGMVYRARQKSLDRFVALKMIIGGELASDVDVRRIHAEAKIIARLKHPNIVPIYEVGVHEEIPYFTMPLMEGGSLADQMSRLHGHFHEVALLVETIARAVHSGHQQGILHRDLKPANVLLDAAGAPYVADFGLAKVFDSESGVTQTGAVEGTLSYMALEQAQPRGQPLTIAVDIYSLGVILYELLTGRLPFKAESLEQLLVLLGEGRPLALRALNPRIPQDLEAICLKCLEKEPARRYGSAAELADDLRRFLEGRSTLARPVGSPERAWMWCMRHPLGAGLLATLIWALLVAVVGAVRIARQLEMDLRNETLRANVYHAPLVADAVLRELEQYGRSLEQLAARPELVAALQTRDRMTLQSFCKDNLVYYEAPHGGAETSSAGSPFDRGFVLDTAGNTLARWPPPRPGESDFLDKDYGWRDYFKGAQRQARGQPPVAYLSRAFVSEANKLFTFALSVPVYSADGTWLGVLVATVASDSTLGSLRLHEPGDSTRTATLVSLTDRSRESKDSRPPDGVYAVLVNKNLNRGTPLFLESRLAQQLQQALSKAPPPGPEQSQSSSLGGRVLEGYRDPVSHEPEMAAFAPVGHTGFVVIVQTRESAVLAVNAHLARGIGYGGLWFVLGLALVWLVFLGALLRFSRRERPLS